MANVSRAFFSRVIPGYLYPGSSEPWWMTGFAYGDAVSVTAQSVGGLYGDTPGVLQVRDVRVRRPRSGGGPTLLFTVSNVGGTPIPGYGVGIGWISN